MIACGDRIILVADAVIDRELLRCPPLVLSIECPNVLAKRGGIQILSVLLNQLREAQQKVRPGVVVIRSRSARERGQASCEVESAARAVGVLRLKVVNRKAIEFHAIASGVLPLDPTQIGGVDVGVIPELEGIRAVLISQIRKAIEEEAWLSSTEAAGAIGTGNVEVRQTRVCPDISVFGSHALAQIANVGIQEQVRPEDISTADSDGLNDARRIARLAAVEGGAACRSERLGIKEVSLLNSITSEERTLAAEVEIDTSINIVTGILTVGGPKKVVVEPGAGNVRRIGGHQFDHLLRSVGDAASWNGVVREWRTPGTIGIACSWVVDDSADAVEVACEHVCGWNRLEAA